MTSALPDCIYAIENKERFAGRYDFSRLGAPALAVAAALVIGIRRFEAGVPRRSVC